MRPARHPPFHENPDNVFSGMAPSMKRDLQYLVRPGAKKVDCSLDKPTYAAAPNPWGLKAFEQPPEVPGIFYTSNASRDWVYIPYNNPGLHGIDGDPNDMPRFERHTRLFY